MDAFNVKGFKLPASAVQLPSFSGISINSFPLASLPHAKSIATSTGTKTGTVRAAPSALNSTGGGFAVTIP